MIKIPYEIAYNLYMSDTIQRIALNKSALRRNKCKWYRIMPYNEWIEAYRDMLILGVPGTQIDKRVDSQIETTEQYAMRLIQSS